MAMLIASGGGFVLEMAVEHFKGVTLFGNVDAYCRTRTLGKSKATQIMIMKAVVVQVTLVLYEL